MTRGILAVGLLAVGTTLATDASATDKADSETRRLVARFAACVVKARHDRAAAAVLSDAGNYEIHKRYADLMDSDCMGNTAGSVSVKFGGDLFRYAIADALVNADFAKDGPTDFSDRLPLAHIAMPDPAARDAALAGETRESKRAEVERRFKTATSVAVFSRYGECIVRSDPADARLWLLTRPDVPEEMSRIKALQPAFSNCLENGTLKFGKMVMRGLVAINYHRLAMATPQPALSKVK